MEGQGRRIVQPALDSFEGPARPEEAAIALYLLVRTRGPTVREQGVGGQPKPGRRDLPPGVPGAH